MKSAALLLALLMAGCASAPPPLTERDDGRTLAAAPGTVLEVRLAENGSTGYSWAADSSDERLVLIETRHDAPSGPPGRGGTVLFRYRVAAPGPSRLALKYWRSWEGDRSVVRRFAVTIN